MNNRFKKKEKALFLHHFNKKYSKETLVLAKILSENQDFLQAKFIDVDRNGIKIAAIERNGEIHRLKVPFRKKIYDIKEAKKAVAQLFADLEGLG